MREIANVCEVVAVAQAAPALARDGAVYAGLDGGLLVVSLLHNF